MFAIVSFDFFGNHHNKKRYIFKTDVENLVRGDVVVVEGKCVDETKLAVFVQYKERDERKEHRSLIKKAHANTLKSLVRNRVDSFKDIKYPTFITIIIKLILRIMMD